MTEWIEYNGSDEQIAEIKNNKNGYIVRNLNPYDAFILSSRIRYAFELWGDSMVNFEYLICNPHPLAHMICQQASTGQPVWIKIKLTNNSVPNNYTKHPQLVKISLSGNYVFFKMTKNIEWDLEAEYSFTEFKEEV